MKRRWGLVLLPILLGLAVWIPMTRIWGGGPILYLRADLGTLGLLGGLLLAIVVAVAVAAWLWSDRSRDLNVGRARAAAAADRRRFLQRLDHELKNPLTAIQAGLANLNGGANVQALDSVQAQTLRLSRLVADLRKLADLETRPIERSPVKLGDVLREALDLAQEQEEAAERRLTLTLPQAPWPLPIVSGDRDLLLLALHNLLNNALKFTQPGDTVEVRAFEDRDVVVVEVADTGPGIPAAELPHVWLELFRGRGARSVPGSGLGLALVRAVAERHGGTVMLRSRLRTGTVVTIRLPIADVTNL